MKSIVEVLMERDGLTESEAKAKIDDVREQLFDAINGNSVLTPEDVMYGELGLEMDYIFELLM